MTTRYRPVVAESYVSSPFGTRTGQYAGMHYGTDFGKQGGSAGMPVYAAQAGTVVYAGAASGFGGPDPAGWVVIDHPTAAGSGTTVYGHIIREVKVGDRVKAGQRIGRVNPNSATNGKVVPHLHFEVHPTVWRAGSQIDPIKWLGNAPSPGSRGQGDQHVTASNPTSFGVDISHHQKGMNVSQIAREGFDYVICRTTDGTYKDTQYHTFIRAAEAVGLVTAAYHYCRNPSEGTTVAQQVTASLQVMGDLKRPIWLDCETAAGLHVDHIRAFKAEFERRGVRVIGAYSYVPWWEGRITPGEPDSHQFGAFWVAAYGRNPVGYASAIYPGNGASQWNYPLGNQKPVMWQFGSNGKVAGLQVDVNAYRGTKAQVKALFYGGTVKPDAGEPDQSDKPVTRAPDYGPAVVVQPTQPPEVMPEQPTPELEDDDQDLDVPKVDPPATEFPAQEPDPPAAVPDSPAQKPRRRLLDVILEAAVNLLVGRYPN